MKLYNVSKILLASVCLIMACSKTEPDQKTQLDDLKKQQAEIAAKIAAIEAKMMKEGTLVAEVKQKMVKVEILKKTTYNHYVEIQGKVDTDKNVMISPEAGGTIIKTYVKRGDKVTKGKLLAEIDGTMIRKGMDELRTSLELATTVYDKQDKLYKDNVGTEVQYLQAKANKESAEGRMASLREQLKKSKVYSPINGYVDEVYKKEGEMAAPGMPAFRIIGLSDFKITGELAESYISKVNVGDEVLISFPDLDKTINAKISVVGASINNVSRTFSIEIRLPNTSNTIKPNMIAYLKIKDFTKSKSIVVPINTVQKSANGYYVYVANGNKTERKIVKLADTYGNDALISEGLNEGDKLVTFGYSDLTDEQPIKY